MPNITYYPNEEWRSHENEWQDELTGRDEAEDFERGSEDMEHRARRIEAEREAEREADQEASQYDERIADEDAGNAIARAEGMPEYPANCAPTAPGRWDDDIPF